MRYSELQLSAPHGLNLFGRHWQPDHTTEIQAVVCLNHGIGDHSGRYQELVNYLVIHRFAVVAIDQMGHGKSGGQRGHARHYHELMDNIALLLQKAGTEYPQLPLFLYGHSWGGNLVLNYALRRQPLLKGVIATSPWLKLAFKPPLWKVWLGQLMSSVYPALSQPNGLMAQFISHDEAVVQAYLRDSLVHDRISASMFVNSHAAAQWALEHAADFPLPLLLIHGTEDRLTSPEGSREMAGKMKKNVSLKLFEGMYHETHHEIGKEAVFQTIVDWMSTQLNTVTDR
jgi:alpha-beta hydrolase superfamily lysophospholipase